MSVFEELAVRCEAAKRGSRELDMMIKAAVYGGVARISPFNGEWCLYREFTEDPRAGKAVECPRSVTHAEWISDAYTSSVDASVNLVPEGWRIGDLSQHDHPTLRAKGDWTAWLYLGGKLEPVTGDKPRCRFAASGPLALTAAALRTRSAIARATGEA